MNTKTKKQKRPWSTADTIAKEKNMKGERLLVQILVWMVVVTISIGLGQLSIGMFFGYGSPLTWMVTLGVLALSCVMAFNDNGPDDDLRAIAILVTIAIGGCVSHGAEGPPGAAGQDGLPGSNGAPGTAGSNGTNGSNGMNGIITNSAGAGAITKSDGTNIVATTFPITEASSSSMTIGDSTTDDALMINGSITEAGTNSAASTISVTHSQSGGTTTAISAISATESGTMDTTTTQMFAYGMRGESHATISTGGHILTDMGIVGDAHDSPNINVGVYGAAHGTSGTNNYGAQFDCSGTPSTACYAMHANSTGTGKINYGFMVGASGASELNVAFDSQHGDVILNDVDGKTMIKGPTTLTSTLAVTGDVSTSTVRVGGANGPVWSSGMGSPVLNCRIGDLFSRTDGGPYTTLYVCTDSNVWTAK